MSKRRPYVRPMDGWFKRDPFFIEYMAHEGTAVFVWLFALEMLAGLFALAAGEAAWGGFTAFLASVPGLLLNGLILVMLLYHGVSWFLIMPRTLPPVRVGGRKVPGSTISAVGLAAMLVASFAVVGFFCLLANGGQG
ncbi:fumarate reductase subunit C [Crenobacter caeni]|uniref:Fumarate reductase subunit C n=1 Tax=Crenobacter caeni TaxID=2705474 RepID=A0A6B2KQL8_9NEIS|nr:fumarate reductase subunit C [Crenobacter caeni]NDV12532.1 fumarate reductase subunit C [Crenobacter caeni]